MENESLRPEERDDLLKRIEQDFKKSESHTRDWRNESTMAYAYDACDQWSEDEKSALEAKKVPPIVFNKTGIFINAIAGLETLNRLEAKFIKRAPGKLVPYDLLNAAVRYVNYDSDAEHHHSHAFRDLVTCGMGWTDTYMDYDTNQEGDVKIERIDPLEMYWDSRASQRNISDARWVLRIKRGYSKEEIEERWPDLELPETDSSIFTVKDDYTNPHDATGAWEYKDNSARNQGKAGITVGQYQWHEVEHFYRVNVNGRMMELSDDQWKLVTKKYEFADQLQKVRLPRRVYKQAFVVGKEIAEVQTLCSKKGFTLQCMTGKHDRNKNVWFGVFRPLKDPQDWTNKLFSQILHIINSNAKGGLMAEKTAFDDVRQAEEKWAEADSIVWAADGAISGGRIMPKPPPPYPQGSDKLMQVAISMFPEVTGMNLELLGLVDKVQPGVLEAQRKQAGMTLLAWAFDAMSLYRRTHGRVLMDFILKYIADGRLVRIAGQDYAQYVPLQRDEMMGEYDIIVDEAPVSPNQKERVFAMLTQLLPLLKDSGMPIIPEILDYSPLPEAMVEKWKQAAEQAKQNPQAQAAQQLQLRGAQAQVSETESRATLNQAKAQTERVKQQVEPFKAIK